MVTREQCTSIASHIIFPECHVRGQLLQPEVEDQCPECIKLHSINSAEFGDCHTAQGRQVAVSLSFSLGACNLISFFRLLRSEGGEITNPCATQCHFPVGGGEHSLAYGKQLFPVIFLPRSGGCFLHPVTLFWHRSSWETITLIDKTTTAGNGFPVLLI